MSQRQNRWFQPKDGISREVIQADIQRYLGRDATVRPGEDNGVQGYWITAYRTLTTEMVRDLQTDSRRWEAEVAGGRGNYTESATHRSRQYYGPSETPAPDAGQSYGSSYASSAYGTQPATAYPADRDRRNTQTTQSGYATTAQYGQETAYTYTSQPQAYAQPTAYAAPTQYSATGYSTQYPQTAYGATPGYPSTSASQPRTTYYQSQDATAQDPYASSRPTYSTQPAAQPAYQYSSTYTTQSTARDPASTTSPPATSAATYPYSTSTHPSGYPAGRNQTGRY